MNATKLLLILSYIFLFYNYLYPSLLIGGIAVLTWFFSDDFIVLLNYFFPKSTHQRIKFEDFSKDFLEDLQIVKFQRNTLKYIQKETFVQTEPPPEENTNPSYVIDRNSRKPCLEYLIKATTRNIITSITAKKRKSIHYFDDSGRLVCQFYISFKTKLTKNSVYKTTQEIFDLEKIVFKSFFGFEYNN